MSYVFQSGMDIGGKFAEDISNDMIRDEPMFFDSTLEYAYSNGGAITKSFLDAVTSIGLTENVVFDSRVHMLMDGWYPCIPGWHHDDVPRNTSNGQPNYDTPNYHSRHILGMVNADICPTEFLVANQIELPKVEGDVPIYSVWNDIIDSELKDREDMSILQCPDRTLVFFDCNDFHRGTKAIASGWRWFGRVSYNTHRTKSPSNHIRRQVQVYLEFPTRGW
jgi:hypothetical protein